MKANLPALFGSALLATSAISALAVAPAQATLTCSASIAAKVTNTTGCEYSVTATQDFLNTNPMTVNSEQFFNFSDWLYSSKTEFTGAATTGTWNISSVIQSNWEDVMLIFKSANDLKLTGYMVQDGKTSGTWSTPFITTNNSGREQLRDVSHISVYYRIAPTPPRVTVPEPTTLFSLGLVGTSLLMTRKRKSAQQA